MPSRPKTISTNKHPRTHQKRTSVGSADTPAENAEARLEKMKLELPTAPKPMGVYQPLVITGKLAYASGHGPLKTDGTFITGRVGSEVEVVGAKAAARQTGLTILATLRRALGSLNKVERVIKTFGLVNCTSEFTEHPQVINGCSELFAEIWGPDKGVGARSAVGTNSLPGNITVEIEMVFLLK